MEFGHGISMLSICVVGSCDVPNQPQWRKPEDDDFPDPPAVLSDWLINRGKAHATIGPACTVRGFDITRRSLKRIEGQFQRHWGFVPALWNLCFREHVNLDISLSVKSQHLSLGTDEVKEQDAAMAASDLDEKFKLEPKWK